MLRWIKTGKAERAERFLGGNEDVPYSSDDVYTKPNPFSFRYPSQRYNHFSYRRNVGRLRNLAAQDVKAAIRQSDARSSEASTFQRVLTELAWPVTWLNCFKLSVKLELLRLFVKLAPGDLLLHGSINPQSL